MNGVVCIRCGVVFPPEEAMVFFRLNPDTRARIHARRARRSVCIGCEQTERDERKRQRRALEKARWTLRFHAAREGMTAPAFGARYGWVVARIVHDIEHAFENTCGYCWRPYAEMEHGLADVTIDIVDRDKPPYYDTNTKPCCRTCNTEKGKLSPEAWALKLQAWRRWRERKADAPTQLTLLEEAPAQLSLLG